MSMTEYNAKQLYIKRIIKGMRRQHRGLMLRVSYFAHLWSDELLKNKDFSNLE